MTFDRQHTSIYAYILAAVFLVAALVRFTLTRQADIYFQGGVGLFVVGLAAGILLDPSRARALLTGRQARYGSNALLLTVAVLGILVVANYLAYQNPKSWDLTADQQYTLAPETIKILNELPQKVMLEGFYTPNLASSRDNIRPLLEQYKSNSGGKLDFEFIDPNKNPAAAAKYGVTTDGSVVAIMGASSEVVRPVSEQELTSALVRLAHPGQRTVYFLTGHGEHDLTSTDPTGYSQLDATLKSKNYTVNTLNLISQGGVPKDALAVIVAGPQLPLSVDEVSMLQDYESGGGSLVVLYEPSTSTKIVSGADPLANYLSAKWGVTMNNDLVVDMSSALPLAGIASTYANHPITQKLQNVITYFPTARSLAIATPTDTNRSVTPLVQTGDNSWGETDFAAVANNQQAKFDSGSDFKGPLDIAVVGQDSKSGARLVVFGDSDFAANNDYFGYGNGDLLVNSIDWAAGQESLINLTPKQQTSRFVVPPSVETLGLIFLLTIVVMPGAVLVWGISTWWRRRRRA